MDLTPKILELPPLRLFGLTTRFISAISPDADNLQKIPPLWRAVGARRNSLHLPPGVVAYGACRTLPLEAGARDDELEYLAGFQCADAPSVPPDMTVWDLPAQLYAVFVHRGPVERFQATLEAIYGGWMPRSAYEPCAGVELERYDVRFHPMSETSELEYLAPIRRRQD